MEQFSREEIEHMITVARADVDTFEQYYNTAETYEKKLEAWRTLRLLERRLATLYEAQKELECQPR